MFGGEGLGEHKVLGDLRFALKGDSGDPTSKGLGKRLNADIVTPITPSSLSGEDEDEISIVGAATIPKEKPYLLVAVIFSVRNSISF